MMRGLLIVTPPSQIRYLICFMINMNKHVTGENPFKARPSPNSTCRLNITNQVKHLLLSSSSITALLLTTADNHQNQSINCSQLGRHSHTWVSSVRPAVNTGLWKGREWAEDDYSPRRKWGSTSGTKQPRKWRKKRNKRGRGSSGERREEKEEEKKIWWSRQTAIQRAAIIRSTVDTLDKECRVNIHCLYVWRYDTHTHTQSTILSLFICGCGSTPTTCVYPITDNSQRGLSPVHYSSNTTNTTFPPSEFLFKYHTPDITTNIQNIISLQPDK